MAWVTNPLHEVAGAATMHRACGNCGNETDFKLAYRKEGRGVAPPFVGLFTDRLTVMPKQYYMVCPICGRALAVDKNFAADLISEGAQDT